MMSFYLFRYKACQHLSSPRVWPDWSFDTEAH